jgi:hypothetical protein
MAKRARGSSTRPGQRPPLQRSGSTRPPETTTAATAKPATLTAEEEARAAALEAQIVAEEKAAETQSRRDRERAKRAASGEPVARGGTIAMRASEEYGYVMRDVRKIVTIGGGLIAVLIGIWAVIQATGVGPF